MTLYAENKADHANADLEEDDISRKIKGFIRLFIPAYGLLLALLNLIGTDDIANLIIFGYFGLLLSFGILIPALVISRTEKLRNFVQGLLRSNEYVICK